MRRVLLPVVLSCLITACHEPEEPRYATGRGAALSVSEPCVAVTGVPPDIAFEMGLDTGFYSRYCSVYGIPVLASHRVDGETVQRVVELATDVLRDRDDVRDALHDRFFRILIAAGTAGESLSDLPEYGRFGAEIDGATGVGPTPVSPAIAAFDGDVACATFASPYVRPGHTFVHEIGHAVHLMAMNFLDPTFDERLHSAFRNSRLARLWEVTVPPEVNAVPGLPPVRPADFVFSRINEDALEYWAHAVEIWFGLRSEPVSVRLTGEGRAARRELVFTETREGILQRDPDLHALLREAFPQALGVDPVCVAR